MPYVIDRPEQLPSWMIRTEIPTVVASRCEDACQLAVWRAIHWLIAIEDRSQMGLDARTIAAHAKVDVKTALRCINGDRPTSKAKHQPRTRKQGLVNLGLLEISGYEAVGKLNPRPVYRIPRWIAEQNARHTWDLLAILGKGPPAALASPPEQTRQPSGLVPNLTQGGGTLLPELTLDPNSAHGGQPVSGMLGSNSTQGPRTPPPIRGLDPDSAQGARRMPAAREPIRDQGGALGGSSAGLDPDSAQGRGHVVPNLTQREIELLLSAGFDPYSIQTGPRADLDDPDALDRLSSSATADPISEQGSAPLDPKVELPDPKSERSGDGRTDGREEGGGTPPQNFGWAAQRATRAPTSDNTAAATEQVGGTATPRTGLGGADLGDTRTTPRTGLGGADLGDTRTTPRTGLGGADLGDTRTTPRTSFGGAAMPSASPSVRRDPFEGLPPASPSVRRDPFEGLPPASPSVRRDPFEGLPPASPSVRRDPFEGLPPAAPSSGGTPRQRDPFEGLPPATPSRSGASFSAPSVGTHSAPPPEDRIPPPLTPPDRLMAPHPLWVLGDLSAHPLDLWRRACSTRRLIDDDQLALLASEHNKTTDGHGWYWVGRAILAAALSEDIHSVAKVRRTLERWRSEDSYGSDAPSTRRSASDKAYSGSRAGRSGEPPARELKLSERLGYTEDMFRPFSMNNK